MKWIIFGYLLINPLFILCNIHARDAQQLCYEISSILVFACGMFFKNNEVKLNKLNISLGIFLITFVFAWLRTMNGWFPIGMNLLLGLMVYSIVIRTLKREDILFLFKGIAWLCFFSVVVLIMQRFGYDLRGICNIDQVTRVDMTSIFFHTSSMGMYFGQVLPLLASFMPLAFLLFVPIGISTSSIACLGSVVGYMFYLWHRKRIWFWIALIPLVLGVAFFFLKMESYELKRGFDVRIPIWKEISPMIFTNVLGHGLDSFCNPPLVGQCRFYQKFYDYTIVRETKTETGWKLKVDPKMIELAKSEQPPLTPIDHPHNEYLWLLYEGGIFPFITLMFIFYFIWERFNISVRDNLTVSLMGSLIAVSIFCVLQFYFHLARLGHLLPVTLGCFYISTED